MRAAAGNFFLAAAIAVFVPGLARSQEPPAGATVLEVPYLPQSELLCGGAAAAMVLRYWGMVGVRPDDFAHLVSATRGGIRASDLGERVRELGWEAYVFDGRSAELRRHLRLGRPVISLLEVGPDRYHYVVLIGEADGRFVLHDPAASPFRLVDEAELEEAWQPTGGLSLLIVPAPGGASNARPTARAGEDRADLVDPGVTAECRPVLDEALAAAAAGRLDEAGRLLDDPRCRTEPAFVRELAGVRLREGRDDEAVGLARAALSASPDDTHAARTLGTALYVSDEAEKALEAWNLAGEPTVDLVRVAGLDRVRYRPVADLIGVEGGDLLTRRSLSLAGRRLADLPAAAFSRVTYAPAGGGRADIVASVVERPGIPTGMFPLLATGLRAALYREVALTVVSPLQIGEAWSGTWRWWENRPGLQFRFDAPGPLGPPAIWTLAAWWERETFAVDPGAPSEGIVEERTGAVARASMWVLPDVRAGLRVGYDRWDGRGAHGRAGASVDIRLAADRIRLTGGADGWTALDEGPGFTTASVRLDAVSRVAPTGLVLSGRAFARSASAEAPMTLWPGAGGGVARPDLLRAHPLLDGGVLTGPAFDLHLAGGGAELTRWFTPAPVVRLGLAGFVDAAHTWGVRGDETLVDAGLGLRIGTAGGGALRIDVATGLSDGEWAVTAGWTLDRDLQ